LPTNDGDRQRSILIIAALSALAWAGIVLVVIVALSTL